MNPLGIAVVGLTVDGLASTAGLVYVVRRVSPWPKPPAPVQPSRSGRKRGSGTGQPADEHAVAVNGSDPAASTL